MLTGTIGLIIYSAISGFFIFFAILDNFSLQKLPALLFLFLVFLMMINEIRFRCKDSNECLRIKPIKENTGQMTAVVIGAAATFLLAKLAGISAVIASAIAGIFAGIVFPQYAVAAFCGSFVGMASPGMFSFPMLLLAGALAALLYHVGGSNYLGVGGKLGTTAFFGTLGVALLNGEKIIHEWTADYSILPVVLIYAAAGACVTHIISEKLKTGVVVASGIVGLVAGIILPLIHEANGASYAALVFCASFAGMASKKVLNKSWLFLIAGAVCGLIFFFSSPYYNGLGGKLGTIAFISVLVIKTLIDAFSRHALKQA